MLVRSRAARFNAPLVTRSLWQPTQYLSSTARPSPAANREADAAACCGAATGCDDAARRRMAALPRRILALLIIGMSLTLVRPALCGQRGRVDRLSRFLGQRQNARRHFLWDLAEAAL